MLMFRQRNSPSNPNALKLSPPLDCGRTWPKPNFWVGLIFLRQPAKKSHIKVILKQDYLMRVFASLLFFLLAGCTQLQTTNMLVMNFATVDDMTVDMFSQVGEPGRFVVQPNIRGDRVPAMIRNGQLVQADSLSIQSSPIEFQPLRASERRITYLWRGIYTAAESNSGPNASDGRVDLVWSVPQPPRRPVTVASMLLTTETASTGDRQVAVVIEGFPDRRIGTIALASLHLISVTIDTQTQTFSVTGPGIEAQGLPLSGTVEVGDAPLLTVSASRFDEEPVEYRMRSIIVFSSEQVEG